MAPRLSVVIPAYNEEAWLGATLDHLQAAAAQLAREGDSLAEIIVVDNASTDATAALAARHGVRVVREPVHSIGRVRNAGARASRADVVVFVDADTLVPAHALARVADAMSDPRCSGGAMNMRYEPRRRLMQWYCAGWRIVGTLAGTAMGAAQFCRRDIFEALGGYDETIYMGEDVEFFLRLRRLSRRRHLWVTILRDVVVRPSSRRMDRWPAWRVFLFTNPVFILPLRRRQRVWNGWFTKPIR